MFKTTMILLWLCCCCSAQDVLVERTKNKATAAGRAVAYPGTGNNDGRFRDILSAPTNIFGGLMRSGVNVVQDGLGTVQGVSSNVLDVARKTATASSDDDRAGENPLGSFPDLGTSVSNALGSGISKVGQATDLGFLVSNIGAHKILGELTGKSSNKEIVKSLLKYMGSRVGVNAKGNTTRLTDDIGTVSGFIAKDEESTKAISTLMDRLMDNPEVSAALIRMFLKAMDSSSSMSCVLDRLPLSTEDVRKLFNVFVGKHGQLMLQTLAGLLNDLTSKPEAKKLVKSVLSMISKFKSSRNGSSDSGKSNKSSSMFGSLKSLFSGNDKKDGGDDGDVEKNPSPFTRKNDNGTVAKQPEKKPIRRVEDSRSGGGSATTSKLSPNRFKWFGNKKTTTGGTSADDKSNPSGRSAGVGGTNIDSDADDGGDDSGNGVTT